MHKWPARGFTLVELVTTLILVAILAAYAMPRMPDRTIELGAYADQLAADLRYVQSRSMTQGARFCFHLTSASSYNIRTSGCGTDVAHPATGMTAPVVLANVTITAVNLSGGNAEFDGLGRPTTLAAPGTDGELRLAGDGQTRTVRITADTGWVVVQ
jgi:prepilin-type N-terminal cleavage/methylation domain-containing protein